MEQEQLKQIVAQFDICGTVSEIKPLGAGLINDTFRVNTAEAKCPDYVLQRVNNNIFPNVEMLMDNILAVTTHLRGKLEAAGAKDIDRKVLRYVKLKDGDKYYWTDGSQYWRIMVFIPNAITKQAVNPESAEAAGRAFGKFQADLADIPVQLGETIVDFHNMEFRLRQLREAVAADAAGRVKEVQFYIDEIEKRADEMCKAERMGREGKLPKRICHCDTKVNNMMFDQNDEVLCVIDLDTVMPNFIFSDYGDFLRTGANTAEEDEPNLTKVSFSMNIFRAFTRGYLASASVFLTPAEVENLPYAAALFPYMQCVRFLADYINGDTYYKIQYPEHNLVRTKNQFKLLQSVEENTPAMKAFIADCLK
ncbi:MAG: aminoglycoside phosphotransferase family protein [Bacteroidaceae bacterium]|nr:aminoglycoside phosphotransferase family protein [Bacteroidaceae bacterium]